MRRYLQHLVSRTENLTTAKMRLFSTFDDATELKDFIGYIDSLNNFEKSGVPQDAGTDTYRGFDLGRMQRLMDRLDNPLSKFKAVHIAGTKGKGSTAAFLSNILRAEGYSVGCYTSPHIFTIRERILVGRLGEPVSAEALNYHFHRIKHILDQAVEFENGHLSHFEVFTAVAFSLFAQENVDIAVVEAGLGGARDATNVISTSGLAASIITTIGEEHLAALGGSLESIALAKAGIIKQGQPLVLGGPFLPHIEHILREKALSMHSPIVSACDVGIRASVKGLSTLNGRPCQSCDMTVQLQNDIPLLLELSDLNLGMLGRHQLQNAVTAACAALCLRHQGWGISDGSIKDGLENTHLHGRSQFLTSKEAEALGLSGTTVLLDGAHTKESAKALVEMIQMTFPEARLALVVAMASDKDHTAFAKEFLSSKHLEAVILTEASIVGGKIRTTASSLLRDCWMQASKELGIDVFQYETTDYQNMSEEQVVHSASKMKPTTILAAEGSLTKSMRVSSQILRERTGDGPSILVVTGSLHIVSMVLAPIVG